MRALSQLSFGLLITSATSQILSPAVDEFIQGVISEWGTPGGVGVAVVQLDPNSGTWNIETKGYGVAKGDGTNVTADTLFSIGSGSKLFTIVGTGLLVSNESLTPRISWDTKVADLIPGWGLADPVATKQSAIQDLMSHRTGLPRHDFMYKVTDSISSVIERLRFLKPSREFRDVWQYSNIMYGVLAELPEVVSTAMPLSRYIKQYIFDPLGMTESTYSFEVANSSGNLADGFTRQGGKARVLPFFNQGSGDDGNFMSGAGGVISNPKNLATWLQTLLLMGKNPNTNETVIPPSVLVKAASGVSIEGPDVLTRIPGLPFIPDKELQSILSPMVYGGGQETSSYRGHVLIEHGGDVPGFHSQTARLPFDNIGVAVLTNDEDVGSFLSMIIKFRILDEALGLEPFDWNSRIQATVQLQSSQLKGLPPPANASAPTPGFADISGTYNNPGYGNWTFCLLSSDNQTTMSDDCNGMVQNITTSLPGGVNPDVPTLIARADAIFAQYVTLQHYNGNLFNISALSSVPTNDPSEPFWTDRTTAPTLRAEFGESNDSQLGFAITGGFWGAGDGVRDPVGQSLQDRAEVWFEKVA